MTYDVITRARRTTRRRLTAVCVAAAMVAGAVTIAVVGVAPDRSVTSPVDPGLTIRPDASSTAGGRAGLPGDLDWVDVAGVSVPVSGQSGPLLQQGRAGLRLRA